MSVPALPTLYRGLPPSPDTLWSQNLDPVLISALILFTALHAWCAHLEGFHAAAWLITPIWAAKMVSR